MNLPPSLPHVESIDVFLQNEVNLRLYPILSRNLANIVYVLTASSTKEISLTWCMEVISITCSVTRAVRPKLRSKVTVAIPICNPLLARRPNLQETVFLFCCWLLNQLTCPKE